AGEDEEEEDELAVAEHGEEVAHDLSDGGNGLAGGAARFLEEDKGADEHDEDAEGGDAKDVFDMHLATLDALAHPAGEIRPEERADVHHGVVDGVADGADVGLGGAR